MRYICDVVNVILLDEVDDWFIALAESDPGVSDTVAAAIDMLVEKGPTLGRPIVDKVKGSQHHNMKEIRPSGTHIRILFIFDPSRNAVLLVAGDKAGNWKGWYETNIPVADQRYQRWLAGDYDS